MKKAIVTFIKYYTYEVEISDETFYNGDGHDAINIAYRDFESEMCSPIADTGYDDIEIEFEDDDNATYEIEYIEEEEYKNHKDERMYGF